MEDFISRRAALDALLNHYEVGNAMQNAMMDKCVIIIRDLPSAQQCSGWVLVSVNLPMPNQYVMCCTRTKSGTVNIVRGYHDGERWCCGMNSNVTHWMPLPDPPDIEG